VERAPSLVVLGASAGGIEALKQIAGGLPPDLPAAVAVVVHISPHAESRLPQILARAGPLQATHAANGEQFHAGHIYVAPPDRHLLVADGRWTVARGPREHHARPAIDPLFRSAAEGFGARAVGVVLSGARADGVAGAHAISKAGGVVIVQDPAEAPFPDMPSKTIAFDDPHRVLPLRQIAGAIAEEVKNVTQEVPLSDNGREEMSVETSYAALETAAGQEPPGVASPYSCPACGGVLWEVEDDDLLRLRCRVGHAYTAESALDDQAESVETALWAAVRALQERASLSERIARRVRGRGSNTTAARFDQIAGDALEQAELIRNVQLERDGPDG
jgi:two-component system chemotaxis response regulator CheB